MISGRISEMNIIYADNENLSYMGRVDFSDLKAPKIIFAGSSITLRFKGTEIGAVIIDHRFYNIIELGALIDGKEIRVSVHKNGSEEYIPIAKGLDDTEHEVVLFKRQDATHYFEFKGFAVKGEVLCKKDRPLRRIECYGDSVSAGAVCEAVDYTAKCDPENHQGVFDNAWHSYSMITARNLGAEINNVAQGGIAVLNGTGYFHAPDYIGMQSAYDKLGYYPEVGITDWDFKRYTPHIVLFAVGQNDQHHEGYADFDIDDPQYREKWKSAYKQIIADLREKYQGAVFVLLLTVLVHYEGWDEAVKEIADELNDDKVLYFKFKRTGRATPGHPRLSEQYEMAEELTAFISNMGDKIWN